MSIQEWNKSYINRWASIIKSNTNCFEDPNFLIEVLAVIKRANYLCTGFHLNDAQILSCLIALTP
jgi:hypothetical protein